MLASRIPAAEISNEENDTDLNLADFAAAAAPDDEKYWKKIAHKYYSVSKDYIHLENGYYSIQPKPVLQAFKKI